jgi:hypothetical protein
MVRVVVVRAMLVRVVLEKVMKVVRVMKESKDYTLITSVRFESLHA